MRHPIGEREHELLSDIARFNESDLHRGWELRGRSLGVADLSGIRLEGAVWEDVDLGRAPLAGARVEGSTLAGLPFGSRDLRRAVFRRTRFVECGFSLGELRDAEFVECAFERCTGRRASFAGARLEGCTFSDYRDEQGDFSGAVLERCRFEGSAFRETRFHGTGLHGVEIADGNLDDVTFSNLRAARLAVRGTSLGQCGIDESEFENLAFEDCTIRGLAVTGSDLRNVAFRKCAVMLGVTLVRTLGDRIAVEDCPAVGGLQLREAQLANVTFRRSTFVDLSVRGSTLSGANRWEAVRLRGANLAGSVFQALALEKPRFEGYLVLDDAGFEGCRVVEPVYVPGLELSTANTRFQASDPIRP
jgi:uncharacterized protein YjbI with pentapeptide repeats